MSGFGGPWSSLLREITIPQDAGPADPRIVITTNPPTTIAGGNEVNAAILLYFSETDYFYLGVIGGPSYGILFLGADFPSTGGGSVIAEYDAVPATDEVLQHLWASKNGEASRITIDSEQVELHSGSGVVRVDAQDFVWQHDFFTDVTLPRGTIDIATGANVGPFTAERICATLTDTSGAFEMGRRYRLDYAGSVTSTVAGDRVRIRIREDDEFGTILRECGEVTLGPIGSPFPIDVWTLYTGRQLVNEDVVLTLQRVAGAGNLTYRPHMAMNNDQTRHDLP